MEHVQMACALGDFSDPFSLGFEDGEQLCNNPDNTSKVAQRIDLQRCILGRTNILCGEGCP